MDASLDPPDHPEVELAVIVHEGDDLDADEWARLDEALHTSKAELSRGEDAPLDQIRGDLSGEHGLGSTLHGDTASPRCSGARDARTR
jgi:hypothetical protein